MDSLKDCQQKEKALITLEVYFPDEIKELLTELDESQDEEPLVETCIVIIVYEEEAWDENDDNDNDDEDELELYFQNKDDLMTEQLYGRHGRPYISKKQRKRQTFKKMVRISNAKLQEPPASVSKTSQHYQKVKSRREPTYKILKKVMSHEEIPSIIQRATYDLTHMRPHVPQNEIPWNEFGVVESACASLSRNKQQYHNSEAQ